jgi:benzoyl-CoA reductase/2-hydroxyglutaryl-CoA dehydratase subunit BcrC/BadD/HgdB
MTGFRKREDILLKDLKYLKYFEDLLQEANNDLIRQAQKDGKICAAYTCENTPEVLLNLPGVFSTRLRAPRTGSLEVSTYYLTSFLCEYTRALLERAVEGGFNYADCIFTPDGCSMMNRCVENMELLKVLGKGKEKFFFSYMEIPMKADDNGLNLYVVQCRNHILKPLQEHYGIDISDEAIRKAVEEHNQVCRLIREIGEFRREANPRITGYEFQVFTLATYVAPKYLLIDKLQETLKELKRRKPDPKFAYGARVVVAGSEMDDIDFIKLVEESGAYVCADRYCLGSFPGRDEIVLNDTEDALTQICRQYMYRGQCPRYMDSTKMDARRDYVAKLAKEYNADGIIYEQMKFCDPWAYEKMLGSHILREEFGYPVLAVDRPYAIGNSGQMRTRVQAFVESIGIKKIRKEAANG